VDTVEMTEVVEQDRRPWWLRLRSACLLGLLLAGLGVGVAAVLGLVAVALASVFDQALG
jgi:hypothetical protein